MDTFFTEPCDDFEDFQNKCKKLPNGAWIYRGQRSCTWRLETAFERAGEQFGVHGEEKIKVERNMLREFKRRLHQYTDNVPDDNSTDEWLALMQHYGAPTRLLDFTYSPHVAAYFAFENAASGKVAVWAIDGEGISKKFKS